MPETRGEKNVLLIGIGTEAARGLKFKRRLLFLDPYPVQQLEDPRAADKRVDHLMFPGKINQGYPDQHHYYPLPRQDEHGETRDKEKEADTISHDKCQFGNDRMTLMPFLNQLTVADKKIYRQPSNNPGYCDQAADEGQDRDQA
jgi:hypothetical protein